MRGEEASPPSCAAGIPSPPASPQMVSNRDASSQPLRAAAFPPGEGMVYARSHHRGATAERQASA